MIVEESSPSKELQDQWVDVSSGATWHRVDLHLHSPGVNSFSCPSGIDPKTKDGRNVLIAKYVEKLEKERIGLCAVTDYNGIRPEWFEPIHNAAASRGIKVFPGVELSFALFGKHGLHILAVFEEFADPKELLGINSFIASLDRTPDNPLFNEDGSHRDIELKENSTDSLRRLCERFGCLLIVPHPGESNGLFKTFSPGDAAKILIEINFDALEHCPESEINRLMTTNILPSGFFERLARVEFSDPKRLEEIGTKTLQNGKLRATYLKLSAIDLGAIHLALHDPATRLVLDKPPRPNHARIRRLEVTGSGFLGNLVINWNDDLNVIIGGRGAGKSAILETIRYALTLSPYAEESYRESLVRHALGSGGKISVFLERPIGEGKTGVYRVERVWGQDTKVYEMDSGKIIAIIPSELLGPQGGPTLFGQREIYTVSASEEYRLRLLDDLIGEEARQQAATVRKSIEALRESARVILDRKKRIDKREEYRQRLTSIQHEISLFEKHGIVEKLRSVMALRNDGQILKRAREKTSEIKQRWAEQESDICDPLGLCITELHRGQSSQRKVLEKAALALESFNQKMKQLLIQGEKLIEGLITTLEELRKEWDDGVGPLEVELNRIKQEMHVEALDPDRLLKLTEERATLGPLIEELNRVEHELDDLRNKREKLLSNFHDLRLKEHSLRRERADTITQLLGDRLRLAVEFKGQKEDYKQRLTALLKGSGVSADAIEKLITPEATDGLILARAVRKGPAEVQSRFHITAGMADRLVRWLIEDESRLFEVETLIPPDALRIELRVDNAYLPLDRLSIGQRATAILLLLFALEGRVLVLDQPEDDLDNRFVYEDIVKILREQKGLGAEHRRRQIIAATHNANIPVIGDAELVLTLEARDGRAHVVGRASIDDSETRSLVKTIMEGGEEAFRRRAEKYGGL